MLRSENTYGKGITFELLRFARQNSRHIPGEVVKFDPDPSKVNWAEVVDKAETFGAHGLFLAAYTDELVPLIREIRSRPSMEKVFLFTSSAFVLKDAIEELGKEQLEGLMFTNYEWYPNDNTNPQRAEFVKNFREKFLIQPGYFAATGYEALNILVETLDPINHAIKDEITESMNKLKYEGPLLGETDFNKSGNVTRIPKLYRVTDGQKVEVTAEQISEWRTLVLTDAFYDLSGELMDDASDEASEETP